MKCESNEEQCFKVKRIKELTEVVKRQNGYISLLKNILLIVSVGFLCALYAAQL